MMMMVMKREWWVASLQSPEESVEGYEGDVDE